MIMNATIKLTDLQLREILVEYLQKEGLGFVSHQDISFNVEYVKKSADKDSCGTHEFTGVTIRNLKGNAKWNEGLIINYYHIRTYTPFCGEEADVYIAAETEEEYHSKANNAADENGMEWFDEDDWLEHHHDDENSIDDYYAQCGWCLMGMITEEEYNRLNDEGEWCI